MSRHLRFGSLFSGIGGFDLGLERAGMGETSFSCAWQCEIDKHASVVLARHWPNVRRYADVRKIGKELEPVDLICGGFPCQDLSVAGQRRGLQGKRSGLWWEFHRVLEELLPQYVIVENVPGLLSSHKGKDMGLLLGSLAQLGYGWAYRVLDAQYFGLAQRRKRVFIVGCLGDWRSAAEILFEPTSGTRDTPPRREAGQGFTPLAGTLAANAGGTNRPAGNANELDFCVPVLSRPLANNTTNNHYDESQQTYIAFKPNQGAGARSLAASAESFPTLQSASDGNRVPAVAFGGNNTSGVIAVETAINAHPSGRYDFESETFIAFDKGQGVDTGEISAPLRVNGAQKPGVNDGKPDNSCVLLPSGVRRLTPLECERLQGFPDKWTEGQADTQRYRQLGNAVAVPVAEWLGRRIMAIAMR